MNYLRILGLTVLSLAALLSSEPPPAPDPHGLGERLALIDLLQTQYGIKPAPGTSIDELRSAYRQAWDKEHPEATKAATDSASPPEEKPESAQQPGQSSAKEERCLSEDGPPDIGRAPMVRITYPELPPTFKSWRDRVYAFNIATTTDVFRKSPAASLPWADKAIACLDAVAGNWSAKDGFTDAAANLAADEAIKAGADDPQILYIVGRSLERRRNIKGAFIHFMNANEKFKTSKYSHMRRLPCLRHLIECSWQLGGRQWNDYTNKLIDEYANLAALTLHDDCLVDPTAKQLYVMWLSQGGCANKGSFAGSQTGH